MKDQNFKYGLTEAATVHNFIDGPSMWVVDYNRVFLEHFPHFNFFSLGQYLL